MTPVETASYFATIIGLICNWRTERGTQTIDQFGDFLSYLLQHHFEGLHDEIAHSQELQIRLRDLLSKDFAFISEKLDLISEGMVCLASKMDALSPLAGAFHATGESLSNQALGMLKAFDVSQAHEMVWSGGSGFKLTGKGGFHVIEKRFASADVQALLDHGFIKKNPVDNSLWQFFSLTRLGSRYAKELPSLPPELLRDVTEQARPNDVKKFFALICLAGLAAVFVLCGHLVTKKWDH
jgi:hypothetical protein